MGLPIQSMVSTMTSDFKLYAVMIEAFEGEWDYVRVESSWNYETAVKKFQNKEDAEKEAKQWNTGQVVEWKFYEK